jgi:hypothetical protein
MWRNYVISVLIGLLLVTSGSSLMLLRQNLTAQSDAERFRQRAAAAEATRTSLQQQVDELRSATPAARPSPTPPPAVSVTAPGIDVLLQQIENDVTTLRGLQPRTDIPVHFLDQATLQRRYLDTFNQDYLPSQRESDQKLLAALGLIGPNESVFQIELGVIQEQILGMYSQDEKVMYLLADNGQFGPDEKSTFAQEFDHALQDQYFDLATLAPKQPDNDDRSLAIQALTEGDATLLQRLWAQQSLTPDELNQLGKTGGSSKLFSAPLFLREQLLFPYTDGFNFIRQIYQTGGYASVDAVFRDPPASTSQILHLEKYRNHVAPIDVALPDLSDGSIGPGWRKINSNVLGELDLRLMLTQLSDSASGVRGTNGWAGDRWELLEKDGHQAVVLKTTWDTSSAARNFFDTFSQAMKNRYFGATVEEASATRQALTATNAATEVRRNGNDVLAVISFDRPTAETIADTVGL